MLKALLKKQLLEINAQFFKDRKTGKARTRASAAFFILMFGVMLLGIGVMFFFLAKSILATASEEMLFLYYFVMGLIAIAIGLLGSVFNTYFTVFDAKDNDLLLSLPIPPNKIVFVRVLSVAAMAALYESTALIPTFLVRVIFRKASALCVINTFVLFFFVTAFVVALSLALGFVVAAVARKVKKKSMITVVVSIVMLVLYYVGYFKAQQGIMHLMQMTEVPKAVKTWMFLFYHMGLAAEGRPISMLIFSSISAGVCLFAYFLLAKNFIRFATSKKSASVKGKKGKITASKASSSLLRRELKRFSSSPNYILNCAFGTLMMVVAGVFFFIKWSSLRTLAETVSVYLPHSNGLFIAAILVCLLSSGNDLTAPSVTLEGKNIWILLSLPVRTGQIFKAKIQMHLLLTVFPALFVSAAALFAIGASALSWVFMLLLVCAFILFAAEYGLVLNLIKPSLKWTSEIVALKQSPSVLVSVFSEYLMMIVLGGLYLPFAGKLWDGFYVLILAVLFAGIDVGLYFWLKKIGVKKFEALG